MQKKILNPVITFGLGFLFGSLGLKDTLIIGILIFVGYYYHDRILEVMDEIGNKISNLQGSQRLLEIIYKLK